MSLSKTHIICIVTINVLWLRHGAIGCSAVCDFGISVSYLLFHSAHENDLGDQQGFRQAY